MDGKFSNSLITADIALVSSQLEISITKMPILKEAVFIYDLSGQKGSFHSPKIDFEISGSDDKVLLVGPGIDVEAVDGNIDAELSISGFSLKGSFSKDTGEIRGTIVSEKTKNINVFWKEKGGTVISESGEQLVSVNSSGDVSADIWLRDLLSSDLDMNITAEGNIAGRLRVSLKDICLAGKYIDSLYGWVDPEKGSILLENTRKNASFSMSEKFQQYYIDIFDYDLSFLNDSVKGLYNIPLQSSLLEEVKLRGIGFGKIIGHLKVSRIGIGPIRNGSLFSEILSYRKATVQFEDNGYIFKGLYNGSEIIGRGSGEYLLGDSASLSGDSLIQIENGKITIDIKEGTLHNPYKDIPFSLSAGIESDSVYFEKLKILSGDFSGKLSFKEDSELSSIISPGIITDAFGDTALLTVGTKEGYQYLLLRSPNGGFDLINRKGELELKRLEIDHLDSDLYISGDYKNNTFSGKFNVSHEKFSSSGSLLFSPKKKRGLALIDELNVLQNEFKNGYIEFSIGDNIIYEGGFAGKARFKGVSSRYGLISEVRMDSLFINYGTVKGMRLNGTLSGEYIFAAKALKLKGDLFGSSFPVEIKGFESGFFDYSLVFSYEEEKFDLEYFSINGDRLQFSGRGSFKNTEDMHLYFNRLNYSRSNMTFSTSGIIEVKGDSLALDLKNTAFKSGVSISADSFKYDDIKTKNFNISGLKVSYAKNIDILGGSFTGKVDDSVILCTPSPVSILGETHSSAILSIESESSLQSVVSLYTMNKKKVRLPILTIRSRIGYSEAGGFRGVFLDELRYMRSDGSLYAKGKIERELSLSADLDNFPIDNYFDEIRLQGKLNGSLSLAGYLDSPSVYLSVSSTNGKINSLKYERVSASLHLDRNNLRINDLRLKTQHSKVEFAPSSYITFNRKGIMNYKMGSKGYLDVGEIRKVFPKVISRGKGSLDFDLSYEPFSSDPLLGKVVMDFDAKMNYTFSRIEAENLTFSFLKGGRVLKEGTLKLENYPVGVVNEAERIVFNINRPTQFNIPDLGLSTDISGNISLSVDDTLKISSLNLKASEGFFNFNPLIIYTPQNNIFIPVDLDVQVEYNDVRFFNFFYDGRISGKLQLNGNLLDPVISGDASAYSGRIILYGREFNVENANATIDGKGYVNLIASNNFIFDRKYMVSVSLQGSFYNMHLEISSIPQKGTEKLKSLLFSSGSLNTGLDYLLANLGSKENFTGFVMFNLRKYIQLTDIKVDLVSPFLGGDEDVSLSWMSHIDRFSLGTRITFAKEDERIRLTPEFKLNFQYSRTLSFDLSVGGRNRGILFAPTFIF